jgi:hypothetical protein
LRTASQEITRNPGIGISQLYVLIEKVVFSVLKRFRFFEVGIVTEIDASIARVRCTLPYQGRESKWLKVYMPFASKGEGFFAMPNKGDHGLVFYILGDLNSGIFFNCSWGGEITIPVTDEPAQAKDIIIHRNGSWIRISPDGTIEGKHKDGNRMRLSDGFTRTSTPNQEVHGVDFEGQPVPMKTLKGQKTVSQKYFVKERTTGSQEPFQAVAFTKIEALNTTESVIFKREIEEPEGALREFHCIIDQAKEGYKPSTSSVDEKVKQERIQRYKDMGNAKDGELNLLNFSRTTELLSIPKGQDLALAEGKVIEKNSEIAFQTWLGRKAYAFISMNIGEKNDQRTASCMIQVMADGMVSDIEVNQSGILLNGVAAVSSRQDDGSAMKSFEDTIARYDFDIEETDAIPLPTKEEIEDGID